ncbi:conserved hypothetical protein [Ricinus communis]|uniref:Uncharacterized protein n=1 Tax=Ricinus communis TaxID=3988 RepID=B9R9U9_RICCO|nr:conserved hypothetical protein [Ricinus communis]
MEEGQPSPGRGCTAGSLIMKTEGYSSMCSVIGIIMSGATLPKLIRKSKLAEEEIFVNLFGPLYTLKVGLIEDF